MSTGGLLNMMSAAASGPLADIAAFLQTGALQAYTFDGSNFAAAGSPLTLPVVGTPNQRICRLGENQIVFASSFASVLQVYQFDGSAWSQVGNTLAIPALSEACPVRLSDTRIALVDRTGIQTYDFDGSDFLPVGNRLTFSLGNFNATALTPTLIIYKDWTADSRYYSFDGSDWTAGIVTTTSSAGRTSAAAITDTLYVIGDNNPSEGIMFTREFVGGIDSSAAPLYTVATASFFNVCVAALSATEVVWGSFSQGNLRALGFNGSVWSEFGTPLGGVDLAEGGQSLAGLSYAFP